MYYVIFGLLGAALLGADQWVKAWVMGHLQLGEAASLFPGFLELMRVHNYGAAWSSFAGQKWLLLGVTGVILAAVLWVLARGGAGQLRLLCQPCIQPFSDVLTGRLQDQRLHPFSSCHAFRRVTHSRSRPE